jgi:hypothetical protein
MTDRPILFSKPMVQALLAGTKTQTRRVGDRPRIEVGDRLWVREAWRAPKTLDVLRPRDMEPRKSTILFEAGGSIANQDFKGDWRPSAWPADGPDVVQWAGRKRQSLHLPRWASRITLTVTKVRVQRLHDMSDIDAECEGVEWVRSAVPFYFVPYIWPRSITEVGVDEPNTLPHAVLCYAKLWDHINGAGAWEKNPLITAYTFEFMLGNID